VPTVPSPYYECGEGKETAEHLTMHCLLMSQGRRALAASLTVPFRTRRDFAEATARKRSAKTIVRWLLDTGRLREYHVAKLLAKDDTNDSDTDTNASLDPGLDLDLDLDLDPGDRDGEEEE